MSKRVEMCRNMSKTAFLSWPILISRKSFLHYHSKAFSFNIRKQKNKTLQAFILVILENEMYKKMKRIFLSSLLYYHIFLILSLQLALIVTRKWKKHDLNHKKLCFGHIMNIKLFDYEWICYKIKKLYPKTPPFQFLWYDLFCVTVACVNMDLISK